MQLVDTINLCLKIPEKMQKTRNESDHPGLGKRPKTGEKRLICCGFGTISQPRMIGFISSLLDLFRLLETQV